MTYRRVIGPLSGTTPSPVYMIHQTGMPILHQNRSKELLYDSLQDRITFIKNPFGPQILLLSRSNHHW